MLLRLENDRQKNDYDQAKSQLDKEQIDFARQENLYKDNLISEQDFRNAKFSLSQRQLSLRRRSGSSSTPRCVRQSPARSRCAM